MRLPEWRNRQRDQLLRTFEFFERWTDKEKRQLAINFWLITIYAMMINYTLRKYFTVP
jgi:hypothetical protein